MQWLEFDHVNLLRNRPTSHFVAYVLSSFVCEKQRHFDFQAKTYRLQLNYKGPISSITQVFRRIFSKKWKKHL